MDFKSILESLGYKLSDDGQHWRTTALYRGGDNASSLRVSKKHGGFTDYGNGESGSFHKLFALSKNIPIDQAKEILGSNSYDIDYGEITPDNLIEHKVFKEEILDSLLPHNYWAKRGIEKGVYETYDGGYVPYKTGSELDKISDRYAFALRNCNGDIIGFAARDVKNNKQKKWKIIGEKSLCVFPSLKELNYESLYLVESIGDFLSFKQRYPDKGCISLLGLHLPPVLRSRLMSYNGSVFICLNNDERQNGSKASVKIYNILKEFFNYNKLRIKIPIKNDFGEMTSTDYDEWERKKSLAVVGSREFDNYKYLFDILNKNSENIGQIVSGGAKGADEAGAIWAKRNSIPLVIFPAEWEKYGKSAGYRRNEDIILNSDSVLAIHMDNSSGTAHSINLAEKYEKKLKVINL